MNPSREQRISTFMEVIGDQTTRETAIHFLTATKWNLQRAIHVYFLNISNQALSSQTPNPLYRSSMEVPPNVWDSTTGSSDVGSTSGSRLSSLNRVLERHLFKGSFEAAKLACSRRDLWLLVNLQSTTEFASHTLNRDIWSNDSVSQTLDSRFVLFQVYDHTTEGRKVSSFYKIETSPPVVLLIDPITGQKMHMWSCVIELQSFLEDLGKYVVSGPNKYIASLIRNNRTRTEKPCSSSNQTGPVLTETEKETCSLSDQTNNDQDMSQLENETRLLCDMFKFLDLTEEPKGDCDRGTVCSLCVKFPDGRRKQRKFLKTEPIQLLWSFCYSQMETADRKAFKLVQVQPIPGASKTLDYGANMTFEQSGLANSMVLVTWE